jgi:hypothetical protein
MKNLSQDSCPCQEKNQAPLEYDLLLNHLTWSSFEIRHSGEKEGGGLTIGKQKSDIIINIA